MSSDISFFMAVICSMMSLLLLLLLMKRKGGDRNKLPLPPGPKKLPILGNLHQLGKLPHRSLQCLSKIYGDLMFLQFGSVPTLVISSPDMAREIFKTSDHVISGRPPLYAAKKLSYNLSDVSFAPYGDQWRAARKIMMMELMTAKRVQSFRRRRVEEVDSMVDQITGATSSPVDISALVLSLSNEVILRAAFGGVGGGKQERSKFGEIIRESEKLLGEFNVADYFPGMAWLNKFNGLDKRLQQNFLDMGRFLDRVIEEHLDTMFTKTDQDKDIVDVLLQLQRDPHRTTSLGNDHIKGVLADIFVGGSESSAAAIIWTMAELIRNPEVKKLAQEEVRNVAAGKGKIEETDLPKLTYLHIVIKESLRLHPPAPLLIPRETTEKFTISDKYEIPAKTRVYFNAAAIARDPKHWDEPEKFWPERFLNRPVDYRGHHFELLPFGSGRRGCPGINFAMPLVELALAHLLCYFDWELPTGISVEDVDMEEALGITMHKKTPLFLVASPAKCKLCSIMM